MFVTRKLSSSLKRESSWHNESPLKYPVVDPEEEDNAFYYQQAHQLINASCSSPEVGSDTTINTRGRNKRIARRHRNNSKQPSMIMGILMIVVGVLHCCLCGGMIFGWAPVEIMLLREGLYKHKCASGEEIPCPEQTYTLGLIFTFASVVINVFQIVSGTMLDRMGPKLTAMTFSFIFGLGMLLFGFSNDTNFQAFIPGYLLMAIGGPPILNSCLHMSNLFPKYMSTLKSVFGGCFGTSALVMFAFEYFSEKYHITRRSLFIGYIPVVMFVGVSACFLWPHKPYTVPSNQMKNVVKSKLESHSPHKGKNFFRQFFTMEIIGTILVVSLGVVRLNYFAETMVQQLQSKGDSHNVYAKAFSIISPLGFLGIPIMGFILDKFGLVPAFIFASSTQLVYNGLILLPFLPPQVITFLVFSVSRPYLYAPEYALISNVMGFQNFGKLVGACNCMIGILSTSEFGVMKIYSKFFKGNPTHLNWIFLGLGFLTYVFPLCLFIRTKRIERRISDENKDIQINP